jgi:hypothetical protein
LTDAERENPQKVLFLCYVEIEVYSRRDLNSEEDFLIVLGDQDEDNH